MHWYMFWITNHQPICSGELTYDFSAEQFIQNILGLFKSQMQPLRQRGNRLNLSCVQALLHYTQHAYRKIKLRNVIELMCATMLPPRHWSGNECAKQDREPRQIYPKQEDWNTGECAVDQFVSGKEFDEKTKARFMVSNAAAATTPPMKACRIGT